MSSRSTAGLIRRQPGRALSRRAGRPAASAESRRTRVGCIVGRPAVDHFVRSERTCSLKCIRRRGGDHVAAPPAPELRRELADTAYCSVDEYPLAG
jgi:hypothetical protein